MTTLPTISPSPNIARKTEHAAVCWHRANIDPSRVITHQVMFMNPPPTNYLSPTATPYKQITSPTAHIRPTSVLFLDHAVRVNTKVSPLIAQRISVASLSLLKLQRWQDASVSIRSNTEISPPFVF